MGVLKSWIPHPPLLFLMLYVCLASCSFMCRVSLVFTSYVALQCLFTSGVSTGFESFPKPTPLPPDCFCFVFAHLAHKGSGFLVHYWLRTGSSGVETKWSLKSLPNQIVL